MLNTISNTIFEGIKTAAVIVAHPDDETLWVGGTILTYPQIRWTVASLCRRSDPDRAPKFHKTTEILNAQGLIADLDDSPDQKPLEPTEIKTAILNILPAKSFDIIITHSPLGEYTSHLRHEEISQGVLSLWRDGKLNAKWFLLFAYEDGGKKYLPKPIENADIRIKLTKNIWQKKKDIIIDTYGFSPESFEAKVASKIEAFWLLEKPEDIKKVSNRS